MSRPLHVLVTGARGFVGRNLCVVLARCEDVDVTALDVDAASGDLDQALAVAEVVIHLAGVNRPPSPDEFQRVNADLTREICEKLAALERAPKFILASSIQAVLDNPYGRSKRAAEDAVRDYAAATRASGVVYRLANLFGKWCRPNYNSVTATFCHNVARGLPIQISEPSKEVELTYIDELVAALCGEVFEHNRKGFRLADPLPSHRIALGELAALIHSFRDQRRTLFLPDISNAFVRALYATYLSYLEGPDFAYGLELKTDPRGSLAEFLKTRGAGQLFISRTKPGITRGNHFHDSKTEKFLVVEGEALIRFRRIDGDEIIEHRVSGTEWRVVDIPPGYVHSIENVGQGELVTLFWSSEILDPQRPDTHAVAVLPEMKTR